MLDAIKLAKVADMMDVWTRTENKAMNDDLNRQEQAMLKMAGEIVRLTQQVENQADRIHDLVERGNEMEDVIQRREAAEEEWRTVMALYNDEVNQLIPTRRFEHRMARCDLGVLHPIMVARDLTRNPEEEEDTLFDEVPMIDLTDDTDTEDDFQDTLELLQQDI